MVGKKPARMRSQWMGYGNGASLLLHSVGMGDADSYEAANNGKPTAI